MPSRRAHISAAILDEVLIKSARRCALCFGLHGTLEWERQGQIAHVNRDSSDAAFNNLAFLCIAHHDVYDSTPRQSRGWTPGELLYHRDRLYAAIDAGQHHGADPVFVRVQTDPAMIAHEREMFRRADAVLNEKNLMEQLGVLRGVGQYTDEFRESLYAFLQHFDLESNSYVSQELQRPTSMMLLSLIALVRLMDTAFETENVGASDYADYVVRPELNPETWSANDEEGDAATYAFFRHEIHRLAEEASDAYREYRRTVKRMLFV